MTYWERRVIEAAARQDDAIAEALPELLSHMQDARRSLEKEINAFYARYATNNKITLAEAQKALSLSELVDFKGDLKAFRKLAKQSIGTFNLEVDNLSVKARITRLEALQAQVDTILQNCYQRQRALIEGSAGALAQEQYLHALYDIEQYTGFQFPYAQLSGNRIAQMLKAPVNGADISSSLWRQDFETGYQIRRVLNNMFTTGRPPQDFAKELQGIIGKRDAEGNLSGKTYEAYRLLYNESAHVSEQANMAAYADDGIDQYQIIATLDGKTSQICRDQDQKVYDLNEAIPGVNYPPFHVNCRTTTVPYIPEAQGVSSTRAARDPETGKTVRVTNQGYKEWKNILLSSKAAAIEKRAHKLYNQGVELDQRQFGAKIGKHARDFGLSASKQSDRDKMLNIIQDIVKNRDYAVQGMWRGQGAFLPSGNRADSLVDFLIKGNDVVVAKDGDFITVLKDGVLENSRVRKALAERGIIRE